MSSTYCYLKMPQAKEGALHSFRRNIISNSTLYSAGVQSGLPAFIQSKPFSPRLWQPEPQLPDAERETDLEGSNETQQSGSKSKRMKQKEALFFQWLAEKACYLYNAYIHKLFTCFRRLLMLWRLSSLWLISPVATMLPSELRNRCMFRSPMCTRGLILQRSCLPRCHHQSLYSPLLLSALLKN